MANQQIAFDKAFTLGTVLELHRFARRTVLRIMEKIERLKIKDTYALENSIKSTVHTNASGSQALIQFFYLYYGECVEQAVGKYRDIDKDLGEKTGVKSPNIQAPEITHVGYGPLKASFKGVPKKPDRERTHRPRPFLRSEIRRNVEYVGWKLANNGAQLIEMHMVIGIEDLLTEEIQAMMMAPFGGRKNISFAVNRDKNGQLMRNKQGQIIVDSSQGYNKGKG